MSDQQLTPDHLEILENAAKRVSKHVEQVKGRVSVLATLPGGVITSEMARNIDTVAEEAKNLLVRIDTEVAFTIAALKKLA